MNSEDLFIKLNYLGPCGHTLNLEHRSALQTTLPLLQKNCKLDRVKFWGKILGISRDYLIAQGFSVNRFGGVKNFCRYSLLTLRSNHSSHDGIAWVQLPDIDEKTALLCDQVRERLVGDPSVESAIGGEDNDGSSSSKRVVVTEEKRLARLIQQIDEDNSVVPRGAYTLNAQHKVIENPIFRGTFNRLFDYRAYPCRCQQVDHFRPLIR